MYQADFICTYKQMDTEEEQEGLYRVQLLQAFGMDELIESEVYSILLELYNLMKEDNNLQTILTETSKINGLQFIINMVNNSGDGLEKNILLFNLLFQYEYFDLFHKCIIEFMESKIISDITMNNLLNVLK